MCDPMIESRREQREKERDKEQMRVESESMGGMYWGITEKGPVLRQRRRASTCRHVHT